MTQQHIRALAICVFRSHNRIFVAEGYDSVKDEVFYRPLGGSIEFGEHSEEAAVRELREEIDAEINDLRYLGTIENLFTFEGQPGHEIVVVYEGKFVDRSLYDKPYVYGHEDGPIQGSLVSFKALWKPLDEFRQGRYPLYPEGLLELLTPAPGEQR